MKKWIVLIVVLILVGGGVVAGRWLLAPTEEQLRKTYWAVREGDVQTLGAQIAENSRVVHVPYKGDSMFLTATDITPPIPRQIEICRILLDAGVDPNEGGGRALWGLVYSDSLATAEMLLKAGADPHRKSSGMQRSAYEEAKWREMTPFVELFDRANSK